MKKPARLPRISISLLFLVIVPWTIVSLTTLRVALLTRIPEMEPQDAEEIIALERALDAYARIYGEYPPDFTSGNPRQEIDEHLQKIFPDRDTQRDVPAYIDDLGPDNALAFWLQGFYRRNARFPLTGKIYLGRNPVTDEDVWYEVGVEDVLAEVYEGDSVSFITSKGIIPVNGVEDIEAYEELLSNYKELQGRQQEMSVLSERTPLHTFDLQRLSKRDAYRPRCCNVPFVYFRAKSYSIAKFVDRPMWGVAKPYQAVSIDGKTSFVRSQRFQLICAGRDGLFGLGSVTVADAAYHEGHADNLTNFAVKPLGMRRMIARRKKTVLARNLSPFVAAICILAYPVVNALRRKEGDLVALAQITRNQMSSIDCSDTWRRKLDIQKHHRRDRALGRLRNQAETSGILNNGLDEESSIYCGGENERHCYTSRTSQPSTPRHAPNP